MNYLDLRTSRFQRRRALRSTVRLWSVVLALCLVGLTMFSSELWRRGRVEASLRQSLESQYEPIKRGKTENADLRLQIAAMRERQTIALLLYEEKPLLTLLGIISRAARADGSGVFIKQFNYDKAPDASVSSSREAEARPNEVNRLSLNGVGVDNVAIARFVAALRDMQLFASVELKSSGATQIAAVSAKSFVLECSF